MGIVNRTPDSFYDPGPMDLDASISRGLALVEAGADLLDVGAVKAGPGDDVSEPEEQRRVWPLVEALAPSGVRLSVETGRPAVARGALERGATMINDVSGLADEQLAEVCAANDAALVLMHNGGQIRGRPRHPRYDDVVAEVRREWDRLAEKATGRGVKHARLVFDPGLDFGKTTFHSLEVMRRLSELITPDRDVLVAPSRKDVIGEALDLSVDQRLEGTLALVALSAWHGARFVRVHDVLAAVRVVQMIEAVTGTRQPEAPVRGLWE